MNIQNEGIFVESIMDDDHSHNITLESTCENTSSLTCSGSIISILPPEPRHANDQIENHNLESKSNDSAEKQNAIWTTNSTETLLKLYEAKLEMLETPKKKTRIWIAISDSLKEYNIEMTPDQVRWKINALAKKYKQCIDSGHHKRFRYFKEMDNIYSRYNVDSDSYAIADIQLKRKPSNKQPVTNQWHKKPGSETKAMIELRKLRLANRIDSDRNQTKLNIERQWLQYLKNQEQHRQIKNELFERSLKLREEELEIKQRELELKESLENRKLELTERDVDEIIMNVEREKCELLKQLFSNRF